MSEKAKTSTPKINPYKHRKSEYLKLVRKSSEFIVFNPEAKNHEPKNSEANDTVSLTDIPRVLSEDDYLSFDFDIDTDNLSQTDLPPTVSSRKEHGDLETWWVSSPTWRRTAPLMCITMLLLTTLHAGVAIFQFSIQVEPADDFDVCKSQACVDISNWILNGLDRRVDPCENFYEFVCSNYKNPNEGESILPKGINFTVAKFQFNDRGVLDSVLRPENDPENIIIPFVKSCLDTRRRNKADIHILAYVVNFTLPDLFIDPVNFGKVVGGARVVRAIGHNGFLRFQFLKYPNISFLPPSPWITDFNQTLSDPVGYTNFVQQLGEAYKVLWHYLERHIGKPLLRYDEAANYAARLLQMMASLNFPHLIQGTFAERREQLVLLLGDLLGDTFVPQTSKITGRIFTDGDLSYALREFFVRFNETSRGPAVLSYWILCILEFYTDEVSEDAYSELNLAKIFTHKSHDLQRVSIVRFCIEAISEHLSGYTFHQFAHNLGHLVFLRETYDEAFRMIRRAMRDIYFRADLSGSLSPYEALILRRFLNPRNKIILNYPFPTTIRTADFFVELEKYALGLKPGPDFLTNLREAVFRLHDGQVKSWKEGHIDYRVRHNFKLETLQSEIDNTAGYENNLYPPIVLFDRPLITNDMRVFDFAGGIVFLTRSFLSLWERNIENIGPLQHLFEEDDPKTLEKTKFLTNTRDTDCLNSLSRTKKELYFDSLASKDALALSVAFQLLRNPEKYSTLRYLANDSLATLVEPVNLPNGSIQYVETIISEDGLIRSYKPIDPSKYGYRDPQKFKFKFKRAPNGLEDFTEDQLFFLAAIRHHCYVTTTESNRSKAYIDTVNFAVQQLKEFAEAWNCPLRSNMNPTNKCI